MKRFLHYLKTKLFLLLVLLFFTVVFAVAFALYHLPVIAVIYPALLCLLFGTVILIIRFFHAERTYKKLSHMATLGAELTDSLPSPETLRELGYSELVEALRKEVIEDKARSNAAYKDMIDYYTVWAHQIKTPISSMKLTLQNEDSEQSRKLRSELFRTQQYVDMVLAFLRMDSESGDYIFREYSLDDIIRPTIKKFASEFICRKLSLDYKPISGVFVTDEKWFAFLIEQLLSNALKYTNEGGISIFREGSDTVCIKDTGIGIAPEDLPRIFEKGYTGNNGRTDKTASGLGLYLCKRVADNLGLELSASSTLQVGTELRIKFKPQIKH